VDEGGLSQQSSEAVEALALKGDPAWNYEFSAYMTTDGLATAGEAGFYPVYVDGQNYVRATSITARRHWTSRRVNRA
jgi:hypothetical protein